MVTVRIDAERTAEENLDYAERRKRLASHQRRQIVRLRAERDEARRERDALRTVLIGYRETLAGEGRGPWTSH